MTKTSTQTLLTGKISAHPRGFGFIACEDGTSHFVPPAKMKQLLPGDIVSFTLVASRNRQQNALVADVLERPESFWLGHPIKQGTGYALAADDAVHVPLQFSCSQELLPTDVVQIHVAAGAGVGLPYVPAEFETNLGPRNDKDFDVRYAVAKWRLPVDFPQAVLDELTALQEPTREAAASEGLLDLTHLQLVTIDGEDTHDFDDAVALERQGSNWVLHVAIADVARYVVPGSALDVEAQRRATSVYLSDRTLPMLPPELSNGLCSLKPGLLRHALVCSLTYTTNGRLEGYSFARALIRSAARLTYQEVADAQYPEGTPEEVSAMLTQLWAWFETQAPERAKRGLMDDYGSEPKLKVLDDGSYELAWVPALRSNSLVEECMLAANRAAAAHLKLLGRGMLFRHQEGPDPEKWAQARLWLTANGIESPEVPSLSDLQELLGRDLGELHEQVAFRFRRSMSPAAYDSAQSSHYSLNFAAYTHFTSPIRRYPDLLVHRMLVGEKVAVDAVLSEHLSLRSRAAKAASRYPWERLKRRLVWRSGKQEHKAQLIGQTERGFKAAVQDWGVLIAVNAEGLEAEGWFWNKAGAQWEHDGQVLAVGKTVGVKLTELNEDGASCELKAVLTA